MKVLVCYNDHPNTSYHKTLRITLPKNWKTNSSVNDLLHQFLKPYNNHLNNQLNLLKEDDIYIALQLATQQKQSTIEKRYIALHPNATINSCITDRSTVYIRHLRNTTSNDVINNNQKITNNNDNVVIDHDEDIKGHQLTSPNSSTAAIKGNTKKNSMFGHIIKRTRSDGDYLSPEASVNEGGEDKEVVEQTNHRFNVRNETRDDVEDNDTMNSRGVNSNNNKQSIIDEDHSTTSTTGGVGDFILNQNGIERYSKKMNGPKASFKFPSIKNNKFIRNQNKADDNAEVDINTNTTTAEESYISNSDISVKETNSLKNGNYQYETIIESNNTTTTNSSVVNNNVIMMDSTVVPAALESDNVINDSTTDVVSTKSSMSLSSAFMMIPSFTIPSFKYNLSNTATPTATVPDNVNSSIHDNNTSVLVESIISENDKNEIESPNNQADSNHNKDAPITSSSMMNGVTLSLIEEEDDKDILSTKVDSSVNDNNNERVLVVRDEDEITVTDTDDIEVKTTFTNSRSLLERAVQAIDSVIDQITPIDNRNNTPTEVTAVQSSNTNATKNTAPIEDNDPSAVTASQISQVHNVSGDMAASSSNTIPAVHATTATNMKSPKRNILNMSASKATIDNNNTSIKRNENSEKNNKSSMFKTLFSSSKKKTNKPSTQQNQYGSAPEVQQNNNQQRGSMMDYNNKNMSIKNEESQSSIKNNNMSNNHEETQSSIKKELMPVMTTTNNNNKPKIVREYSKHKMMGSSFEEYYYYNELRKLKTSLDESGVVIDSTLFDQVISDIKKEVHSTGSCKASDDEIDAIAQTLSFQARDNDIKIKNQLVAMLQASITAVLASYHHQATNKLNSSSTTSKLTESLLHGPPAPTTTTQSSKYSTTLDHTKSTTSHRSVVIDEASIERYQPNHNLRTLLDTPRSLFDTSTRDWAATTPHSQGGSAMGAMCGTFLFGRGDNHEEDDDTFGDDIRGSETNNTEDNNSLNDDDTNNLISCTNKNDITTGNNDNTEGTIDITARTHSLILDNDESKKTEENGIIIQQQQQVGFFRSFFPTSEVYFARYDACKENECCCG